MRQTRMPSSCVPAIYCSMLLLFLSRKAYIALKKKLIIVCVPRGFFLYPVLCLKLKGGEICMLRCVGHVACLCCIRRKWKCPLVFALKLQHYKHVEMCRLCSMFLQCVKRKWKCLLVLLSFKLQHHVFFS